MANPLIHDLGMVDTEYAALVAKGYEPVLEHQLIALGEEPDRARKLTRLAGLVQNKPPETDEEWNEFMETWAEVATDECPIRTAVPTSASSPY
ncbi:MAG TPA: hypothetical protein V6C90_09000 [Coleofasciculaceae cyanobacterium]